MREHYLAKEKAQAYDRRHTRTLRQRMRLFLELRLLRRLVARICAGAGLPHASVLDIPCGTGRHSAMLQARGHRLLGADISAAMLDVARERETLRGSGFRSMQAELERLPLADNSVDIAMSIRFLRHIPAATRWQAIGELARVARHGAVFDLLLKRGLVSLYKRMRRPGGPASQRPTRREAEDALAAQGLEVVAFRSARPWFSQQHFFWVRPRRGAPQGIHNART